MKNWLKIAALMMCLMLSAAFAEETAENVVVYFNDGAKVLLPAEIANDDAKLAEYCDKYFPGRMYSKDAETAAYTFDASVSEKWMKETYGEDSHAISVRMVKLGVYTSLVATTKGEELTVPTAELTIRGFGDKAHQVAVISAPRTGTASLRDKASGNGKVIDKCAAGKVVAVLEYVNGTYSKILYGEEEGYIRTDCLIFQDTAKAPVGTGVVHVKDAVDGKSDVTVRNTASKSTSKVAAVPTGTEVCVHGMEGDWYIVEGDGWLGYIHKQNLKMTEN